MSWPLRLILMRAQCLIMAPCRHARELRDKLDQASQAKAQMQAAVEALQKHGRPEDAAVVEEAIQTGQSCSAALDDDVAAARQALQRWQLISNNEAKLAKALKDGTSIVGLSRAIQVSAAQAIPHHYCCAAAGAS